MPETAELTLAGTSGPIVNGHPVVSGRSRVYSLGPAKIVLDEGAPKPTR